MSKGKLLNWLWLAVLLAGFAAGSGLAQMGKSAPKPATQFNATYKDRIEVTACPPDMERLKQNVMSSARNRHSDVASLSVSKAEGCSCVSRVQRVCTPVVLRACPPSGCSSDPGPARSACRNETRTSCAVDVTYSLFAPSALPGASFKGDWRLPDDILNSLPVAKSPPARNYLLGYRLSFAGGNAANGSPAIIGKGNLRSLTSPGVTVLSAAGAHHGALPIEVIELKPDLAVANRATGSCRLGSNLLQPCQITLSGNRLTVSGGGKVQNFVNASQPVVAPPKFCKLRDIEGGFARTRDTMRISVIAMGFSGGGKALVTTGVRDGTASGYGKQSYKFTQIRQSAPESCVYNAMCTTWVTRGGNYLRQTQEPCTLTLDKEAGEIAASPSSHGRYLRPKPM